MNKSLLGLGQSDMISRLEGFVFLALFIAYLYICFKLDSKDGNDDSDGECQEMKLGKSILLVILGLAGLIGGGRIQVSGGY